MADALATWIVEFDASGAKAVEMALSALMSALKNADDAQKAFAAAATVAANAAAASYASLTAEIKGLASAFGLSITATAVFTAGLFSGTAQGQLLLTTIQQISREFVSVFLPVIRTVTAALQDILNFFRSLTGAQQDLIASTVLLVAELKLLNAALATGPIAGFLTAFGILATMAGEVANLLAPITAIFKWLAESGTGAIIVQIVALTAAFYTMGVVIQNALIKASESMATLNYLTALTSFRMAELGVAMRGLLTANPLLTGALALAGVIAAIAALNRTPKQREQVGVSAGAAEDLERTWFRLQQAALGQDIAVAQLEQLRIIAENTGRNIVPRGGVQLV